MHRAMGWKTRLAVALAASAAGCAPSADVQDQEQPALVSGRVASATIPTGSFAYFVPDRPRDVALLVHGYPWPDDSRTIPQLIDHAVSYVTRWQSFADEQGMILIAPAFGSGDFAGYRELFGRRIDADAFADSLAQSIGARFIDGFDGRFYLYGHSAGGQFAGRFLVRHAERLKGVVISAPSTYPFPDASVPWPYGMAAVVRSAELSGTPETGKDPANAAGAEFRPDPAGWLEALEVPVAVIVGSADDEPRADYPGQTGKTRIERAQAWVSAMGELARSNEKTDHLSLTLVEGVAHDPVALTVRSQELLLRDARPRPSDR